MDQKIHFYAQRHEHDDVFIIADRQGLALLRDACEVLLQGVASSCAFETMTEDGEGFACIVAELPPEDPKWKQLMLPYTDGVFAQAGLPPAEIVGVERYRELRNKLREQNP